MGMERIKRIEQSKGIAIILVVLGLFIVLCKIFLSGWCGNHLYVMMATLISVAFPLLSHEIVIKRTKYLNFVFEPKKYIQK